MKNTKPVIGVIADSVYQDNTRLSSTGKKYMEGLTAVADVLPVVIPSTPETDIEAYLKIVDGIMLTGSLTNVHPAHYGVTPTSEHAPFDEFRDRTAFAFIEACLEQGVPLLGICRGFQELNVALGGSLTACVHEIEGRLDHREPDTPDRDIKHADRHRVTFTEGGLFQSWTGETSFMTNSLHRQAVDRLADRLKIEAICEDGTIEGVSVIDAKAFAVAVQWHPEYEAHKNVFSQAFFKAFESDVRQQRSD
ncbi:MAG: gamma-glutamyl-gamma-aminobutyrate hydrolase family protein [Parvibaculales bacterium]